MGNVDILWTDPRTKSVWIRLNTPTKAQFVLRASDLNGARENMKVLQFRCRDDEITTDVDKTPHAWYFQQAGNGICPPGVTGTGSESRIGSVGRETTMTHDNKLQVLKPSNVAP
jgi:hypothetical protein